jgi:protein-tyrosine phosphatase
LTAGYVPILTHPERLTWIKSRYEIVQRLAEAGVWMQITAGSLAGAFGKGAQYWGERMLDEGLVHILATDAHDTKRRPPTLSVGRDLAAARVGEGEAEHLVATRPRGVLENVAPSSLPLPALASSGLAHAVAGSISHAGLKSGQHQDKPHRVSSASQRGSSGWLRRLFEQ